MTPVLIFPVYCVVIGIWFCSLKSAANDNTIGGNVKTGVFLRGFNINQEEKCTKILTKRPADAEQDGVVIHFLHSVVLQQHTRVRIHIGPRVLDLACLEQDRRHQVVELADQLEQGIVG